MPRPDIKGFKRLDVVALALLLALALGALEIAIKEAPERGWSSLIVVGLLGVSVIGTGIFVDRTLRSRSPLVNFSVFSDRNFVVGCILSFVLGIGLFGSVYIMPVFLAYARHHSSLEIGKIMLVTGVAQLLTAPLAVVLEKRFDERYITTCGFLLFGVGLALSCVQTPQTDYDQMYWPQVVRGAAIMLCILPPTRLALGQVLPDLVPDASGLFNMMRNLGGAIGIALVDTVIYSRAPVHSTRIVELLTEGDAHTIQSLGIPPELMVGGLNDPQVHSALSPLVERLSFVDAVNDAWALVSLLTFAALICIPVARAPIWRLIISIRRGDVRFGRERVTRH